MGESGLQSCLVVGFHKDMDSKGNIIKKETVQTLNYDYDKWCELGCK